nr:MAG TPA: hypothetical protein [Caudoviricetes sp.]
MFMNFDGMVCEMSFNSLILNCYCLSVNVAGGGWLCAVVVRGMSVVCPGWWFVVCPGWWCTLSIYVPLCEKWTFKHGGWLWDFQGVGYFCICKVASSPTYHSRIHFDRLRCFFPACSLE